MISSDAPDKFIIPFAQNAGIGYVNTIPVSSQIGITDGRASLNDGFPPLTFTELSAGGQPPFGADFNGILKEITTSIRWANAGGQYKYDATFSGVIGGYPKGAILLNDSSTAFFVSTKENNTTNPNSGPSNDWVPLSGLTPIATVAKLRLTVPLYVGQQFSLLGYSTAGYGGGIVYYAGTVADNSTDDGFITFVSFVGGIYYQFKRLDTSNLDLYAAGGTVGGNCISAMNAFLASSVEKIKVPDGVTLGSHSFSATRKIIIGGNAVTFTGASAGFVPVNVEYLEITGFTNGVMSSVISDSHRFFYVGSGATHGVVRIAGNSVGGGLGGVVASYENGRSIRSIYILDNDFNDQVGELGGQGYGIQYANENASGEAWVENNKVTRAGRHSYYIARNAGGTIHFNDNKAIDHRQNSTTTRGNIRPAMFFARCRNIVGTGNAVHGFYDGAFGYEWESEAGVPSPLPLENVQIDVSDIRTPKNNIEAISYGLQTPTGSMINGINMRGVNYFSDGVAAPLISFNYGKSLKISDIYAKYVNMSSSFNVVVMNANSATDSTGHIVDRIQVAVETSSSATLNVFRLQNGSATDQIRTKLRNVTVRSNAGTNNTFSTSVNVDNALIQLNNMPDDGLSFNAGVYAARTPNPSVSLNIRTISTVITTPVGTVTPRYLYEEIYLSDPGAKSFWRANGTTSSDWIKTGP